MEGARECCCAVRHLLPHEYTEQLPELEGVRARGRVALMCKGGLNRRDG
jgi:hypothetical protein